MVDHWGGSSSETNGLLQSSIYLLSMVVSAGFQALL